MTTTLLLSALLLVTSGTNQVSDSTVSAPADSIAIPAALTDSIAMAACYTTLTEADYQEVAKELGVEVASVKAIVDIEAGPAHKGFYAPGKPIINFDLTMFRRFAGRKGINLSKYYKTHNEVFLNPDARRHGSTQAAQWARLKAARGIDNTLAVESTFWGMFQIGGFNWKKCGASSIDEFVKLMSRSERDQLELFAKFLISTGLDKPLREKNWSAFARGYNGPAYARRGYHTRMASAYARHRKLEKVSAQE